MRLPRTHSHNIFAGTIKPDPMNWKKPAGTFCALVLCLFSRAQSTHPASYELAVGLQSYYAPLKHMRPLNPQPVFIAGANRAINPRQTLELGVRIGYHRNKYQGDALFLQTLFRYAPVIFRHLQPQAGIGIGYQLSFHPGKSWQHNGNEWVKGRGTKGIIQVPVQLGLGYHSLETQRASITPYVAWQLNALFRYSPDLSPLPASQWLVGVRYARKK